MHPFNMKNIMALRFLLFFACALALQAPAANVMWDSDTVTVGAQDGAGTWDTATANWTNGTANVVWPNTTADTATIGAASGAAGTITVSGTITLNKIQFNAPSSGNYTISGGTLSFGGTTPTLAFAAALLSPTVTSVLTGSSGLTFGGNSSSGGSSSTITLGGANTYSGLTTIQKIVVNVDTLANAGTASSLGTSGNVSLGTANSACAVNYIDTTGVPANTDRLWVLGGSGASTINNNGFGGISFNGVGTMVTGTAGARSLTLGGNNVAANGENNFGQVLSDMSGFTTSVTKSGSGTWALTGSNTHSGNTTLSAGLLKLGHVSAVGASTFVISGNGSFDNTTGAPLSVTNTFTLSGGSPTYVGSTNMTFSGPITISGANRTITVNANTLTLAGSLGDAGQVRQFTKAGGGRIELFGTNTYSGGTVLNAGTLAINSGSGIGTGTNLNFGGTASLLATTALELGTNLTINLNSGTDSFDNSAASGNTFEIAARITGTATCRRASQSAFTKGAVRFSNDGNDYTGNFTQGFGLTEFTSVANGGSPSALGAAATAYAINNSSSGAIFRHVGGANTSTTRAINWQGNTGGLTLENNGAGTVGFLATDNLRSGSGISTLTLQGSNSGANMLAQTIADSGGTTTLAKLGSGTWVLSGTNTYTGLTTNGGGTLRFAKQVALYNNTPASWTAANIVVGSNTTLALNVGGAGEFTASDVLAISGLGTASGGFLDGSFLGLDTSNAGGNFNYGGVLANANATGLRKLGSGLLTLTVASTYTGPTIVEAGALVLSGAGSIANSSSVTVAPGALLDVSGAASTFTLGVGQALVGSGTTMAINGSVNANAGSIVLNFTNGTPALTITGGALVLSNNNITVTVAGTVLAPGSYKLIAKGAGGSVSGTIAASALFLGGAGVSGSSSLLISGGELYLVVTPLQLPYPQGSEFPLMLYSVQTGSDMSGVTAYGWNMLQRYGLANTNGDVTALNNYIATAWSNNATASAEIPGHYDGTSRSGMTQSEVQSWIEGVTNNPNIAWWNLPEELRYSVLSERQELTNYVAWTRLYDPLKRPTYEYQANHVTATQISQIITNADIVAVGAYAEYAGMPHAWVRYRVQDVGVKGVTLAGRMQGSNYLSGQKIVIAVLYAATNDVNPGVIASPAEVYHDVWSAIASGAQGISVYSHFHATRDDPALLDNLAMFNLAAAQISGSEKIGQAVLFGTNNSGVTNVVTAGPTTTVSFTPAGVGSPVQYSSLNVLSKTWSNNVYVIAVNSTSNSVTANITNLPVASGTASVPFESRTVSVNGGGFSDTFAAWGVHVYKLPAASAPALTPIITSISVLAGTTTLGCSNGTPGVPYLLLRSTNLANPSGWVSVGTNTPSGAGLFSFTNSAAGSPVFYRLQAQ